MNMSNCFSNEMNCSNLVDLKDRFEKIQDLIDSGIVLYGAGANGVWCLDYLTRNGFKVLAFIDSDSRKIGSVFNDIPVISYQEYTDKYKDCVILVTAKHAARDILNSVLKDNNEAMAFDSWFVLRNDDLYNGFEFADDRSYETLNVLKEAMLLQDESKLLNIYEFNHCFAVGPFNNTLYDTFVDCGAFTGDTLERFINAVCGSFNKAYCFEPGRRQFDALSIRKDRILREWALDEDKIELVNAGVGEKSSKATFDGMSMLSSAQICLSDEGDIQVYALDDYLDNREVSWIKSDIEGFEMDMLKGATKLIEKYHPKFTISVYHKPDDLFRVYEYLRSIHKDYKFALRHHAPKFIETMLYVW